MGEEIDDAEQSVSAVATSREYGVYCYGLAVSCILILLVIAILLVLFFVEGEDATIILPVLLVLLIVIAIGSFVFIKWQHNNAVDRRNQGATEWIHRTLSQQQLPIENIETVKSSWAFWRKSSSGSSGVRPTAPPESTNTSMSTAEKTHSEGPLGYQAVSTREITV